MADAERCVCCGEIIPEGRMVCPNCMEPEDEDPCPCDACSNRDYCDGWDARYCCTLCQWYGMTDCDNCDPMDI